MECSATLEKYKPVSLLKLPLYFLSHLRLSFCKWVYHQMKKCEIFNKFFHYLKQIIKDVFPGRLLNSGFTGLNHLNNVAHSLNYSDTPFTSGLMNCITKVCIKLYVTWLCWALYLLFESQLQEKAGNTTEAGISP